MSYALAPTSRAVFARLNVAALLAVAPGGVSEEVPRGTTPPNVMFEVQDVRQLGGFGTKPGNGAISELEIRVHAYSTYEGFKELHPVMAKVVELLTPGALAVTGYRVIEGPNYDDTVPFGDQVVAGVRVNELVARFTVFVEEL